jgi:hypothetical protein
MNYYSARVDEIQQTKLGVQSAKPTILAWLSEATQTAVT